MNKEFKNPYEKEFQSFAGPDKNLSRAPASIDATDYSFIRGIRPSTGTVNTTQCLLWSKLVETLKKHGITDMSKQSEFESFVANCVITDGRDSVGGGTVGRDGGKTTKRNVRRGTAEPHPEHPDAPNVQPVTPSGVRAKARKADRTVG